MPLLALAVGALSTLVSLGAATHALLNKRDPRSALGWVLLCLGLPVGGALIYFMFGINRLHRRASKIVRRREGQHYKINRELRKFRKAMRGKHAGGDAAGPPGGEGNLTMLGEEFFPAQPSEERPEIAGQVLHADFFIPEGSERLRAENISEALLDLAEVGYAVNRTPLLAGNSVEALHDGDAAYPEMLEAMEKARRRIWLSSYIFENDVVGRRFGRAMAEAQARGVQVLVLLDGLGSYSAMNSAISMLRGLNLPVAVFLPPRLFPPQLFINLRDHRKLLIVDGRLAFTGGMNVSAGHVRALYRAVERGEGVFRLGGEELPVPASFRHPLRKFFSALEVQDLHFKIKGPLVAELEAAFAADWNFCTNEELEHDDEPARRNARGTAWGRVILDGPDNNFEHFGNTITAAISCAQSSVRVITPYFLPPRELTSALQCAALRGVEVSIILPEKNDQFAAHYAAFNLMGEFLRRNVKIYYQPPPFAHTKLLLIDGFYVHFGSANLDARSMRLNFELTVETFDRRLGAEMDACFTEIISRSRRYTLEDLERRSFAARLRDAFFWLGSPYL